MRSENGLVIYDITEVEILKAYLENVNNKFGKIFEVNLGPGKGEDGEVQPDQVVVIHRKYLPEITNLKFIKLASVDLLGLAGSSRGLPAGDVINKFDEILIKMIKEDYQLIDIYLRINGGKE